MVVSCLSPLAVGAMDHHEAAAADIAGARIGHREREGRGHRGVDRIAASLENIGADARGDRFLGDHHAVCGGRRMRVADLRIEPAFGARGVMARDVVARDVVGKAVREERKRDKAGECQTERGLQRLFLHGAD